MLKHRLLSFVSKPFSSQTFYYRDLIINKTKHPAEKLDPKKLIFGHTVTDHVMEMDWSAENGWERPTISPIKSFAFDPRVAAIGQSVHLFEGLKAYSSYGKISFFRPEENCTRLQRSAARIGLPSFDSQEYIKCLKEFVLLEQEWIPPVRGFSLYIRPTFISTDNSLELEPARKAKLFTLLLPCGNYFKDGTRELIVATSDSVRRSNHKGFGFAKIGGNYGATLGQFKGILNRKIDQILWLDKKKVTEVGVMNFVVVWKDKNGEIELVTSKLSDSILNGVTRRSLLQLAKEKLNIKVSERDFSIDELIDACQEGRMLECFGCGTAAIVAPIGIIVHDSVEYKVNFVDPLHSYYEILRNEILDIQGGKYPEHPWYMAVN